MRIFSLGSLRIRLIFLVLLAVVPMMGLMLYSGLRERQHALSKALDDALGMAKNVSGVQERLFENTRQIFFVLSQMPGIQQLNADECSQIFASLQKQTKAYTAFFATKPNGDLFVSALPVSGHMTFTDRAWYQQVLKTRKFAIGDYVIGRLSGKATVVLAYPVFDRNGQIKLILGTELDLGWLNQFIAENKPLEGTTLNVADRKGNILLRYPEPEKFVGKTMPEGSIFKTILAKGEGISEAMGLDGVPRLYGFISLDRFSGSVYVSVGIPKETAFAEANQVMVRNLMWLGIVAVLAIGAAWVAGSFLIIKPVNRLLGVSERLGEGDLAARIGPRYKRGELGQLGSAFDRMSGALQKRDEVLRRHRDHLEELVEQRTFALRESEEFFRIAAKSVSDLIWNWDIVEGKLEWFGNIDESLGYEPGTFPRTIEAREKVIHPEDRKRTMQSLDRHLETGERYFEEYRVLQKGGAIRFWTDSGVALSDAEGKPYRMIGAVTDITGRKQAEEEIRKLNAELEQRVIDRTSQLEAANKDLDAFSYSVSHDLRAPLRTIDGFSLALLEDYEDKLDAEGKRLLNIIRNNTQKMGKLIEDLLAFSHLGKQEIRVSGIDMEKLAKAVFEELKLAGPQRKMEFSIKPLASAQGDPAMIRQVFTTLLSNAIKFTRPKEMAVIEAGGRKEENENIYYVKDNGVGFDMQYVSKLFGVFQRLHSSEEFEGTGVGLAIVQRIIHRHGGKVWAEGKVGEGAIFFFSLPAK